MATDLIDPKKYPPDSAMAALPSDRMRAFVEALFEIAVIKPGHGLGAEACRVAGYEAKNPKSLASMANNLRRDPRIQNAIIELTKQRIRELGPKAIAAISNILDNPHHNHYLKAALIVMDKVEPPTQKLEVTHEVVNHEAETLKYLDHLLSLGTPREVLEKEFGKFGLERFERLLAEKKSGAAKIIDAEFTEISPAQPEPVSEPEELDDLL